MNRSISGLILSIALLLAAGCASDPTGDLRNGVDKLVAAPTQLFIDAGETKTVEVGAVDAQGNPISNAYEVTSNTSGIAVERDTTFLPVFVDDSTLAAPAEGPRFRFLVTGVGFGQQSFTVEGGGASITVPVQVVPIADFPATFSSTSPALGDTITITAPAGSVFTDSTQLLIAGATNQPLIVERSPDGTTIRFLLPPSVNAALQVTNVVSAGAPTLIFNPTTTEIITTPLFDSVDVVFDVATPTVGQTVTVTLPTPLIRFQPTTTLTFPLQLASGANFTVSADSSTLTFEAPPNATGPGTIDSLVFPGGYVLSLPTRPTITAENIGTTVAATFAPANPAVNQTVTLTTPAGFSLDPAATVAFPGSAPDVLSQDATSFTFTPAPGTTAPATISGLLLNSAPQFNLTMQTVDTLAASATVPTAAGTDDPVTAPTLTTPPVGGTSGFYDAPDFAATVDHFYKLVVATAGDYTITLDWTVGSDIDLFVCPVPGAISGACDFTAATGAHPESATFTLAVGTHWLVADDFGADAAGSTLHISVAR